MDLDEQNSNSEGGKKHYFHCSYAHMSFSKQEFPRNEKTENIPEESSAAIH